MRKKLAVSNKSKKEWLDEKIDEGLEKQRTRPSSQGIREFFHEKFTSVNIVMQIETSFSTNFERSSYMVRNTMCLIRQADTVINPKYDIYAHNINDICNKCNKSNNVFKMIVNSFRSIYMQGIKTAEADTKNQIYRYR